MLKHTLKYTALATAVASAMWSSQALANNKFTKTPSGYQINPHALTTSEKQQILDQKSKRTTYLVVLKQKAAADLMASGTYSQSQAQTVTASIRAAQQQFTAELQTLASQSKVLGSTEILSSTLILEAQEHELAAIKANPLVAQVLPIYPSEIYLNPTVEYLGVSAAKQDFGVDGTGIRAAVLDTGVDYTHEAFNPAAGTLEAYALEAEDPTIVSWPQGSVIGGYDYQRNDADPIENDPAYTSGTLSSHGTHVSHDLLSMAPAAELYVYTVCSDTGGCGPAPRVLALEAAMDPNGDGDISDRVDVINLSLGSEFGTTNLSQGADYLIQQAVKLGTSVVIAAGNDGDIPYTVGSPSTVPNALSVASLTHPNELRQKASQAEFAGNNAEVTLPFYGPQDAFTLSNVDAPLVYPKENQNGCTIAGNSNVWLGPLTEDVSPFEGMDFSGKAVLIDRGVCPFTEKVLNAQNAGADFVMVANNVATDGPSGMGGTDSAITIRSIGIDKATGDALKAQLEQNNAEYTLAVEIDVTETQGAVSGFSSRGPSMDGLLKPEIAAPGSDILAASPATGNKYARSSGTSMASPILAGNLALLRQARPELDALEVKATLMNTADLNIYNKALSVDPDSELAPISRIGSGLVNISKAIESPVAAWVDDFTYDTKQAALSFGLMPVVDVTTVTKTVKVKNFSDQERTYQLRVEQRYQNDIDSGAISFNHPATIKVPANSTIVFDVDLTIDPAKLPEFNLNTPFDNDQLAELADALTLAEYDGALVFDDPNTDSDHDLHVVYHIIPKAEAAIDIYENPEGEGYIVENLSGKSVNLVSEKVIAGSPKNESKYDIKAVTASVTESEQCESGLFITNSVQFYDHYNHNWAAGVQIVLDVDNDGVADYIMKDAKDISFVKEVAGRSRTFVDQAVFSLGTPSFYNQLIFEYGSDTMTLSACAEHIGLDQNSLGQTIAVEVSTGVPYLFGGVLAGAFSDAVAGTFTLSANPESVVVDEAGATVTSLAPGQKAMIPAITGPFALTDGSGKQVLSVIDKSSPLINSFNPYLLMTILVNPLPENSAPVKVAETGFLVDLKYPIAEYTLTGEYADAFSVDDMGNVMLEDSSLIDFDAGVESISLTLTAANAFGSSGSSTFNINIGNELDEAPQIASSQSFEIEEDAAIGSVVGVINAMIKDLGATAIVSYELTGSELFSINENGEILVASTLTNQEHEAVSVQLSVTDDAGLSSSPVDATINIKFAEAAHIPSITSNQTFSIDEDASFGSVVGQLAFTAPADIGVSFLATGSNQFTIDEAGTIKVAAGLDYEYAKEVSFYVEAMTAEGFKSEPTRVIVNVNDIEESEDSSGSFWLTLMMLPALLWRRRK